MGDFFLDFRAREERGQAGEKAAALLRFCEDSKAIVFEENLFSLVLSSVDEPGLWGPGEFSTPKGNILVAVVGRPAFDEEQWRAAEKIEGRGGLVSKAILKLYLDQGVDGLGSLNGHFIAVVADRAEGTLHLATDRFGMCIAYGLSGECRNPQFCSHPDVLAAMAGESSALDKTSIAEFLMTGRLSYPHTYYRNIKALETATIHTFRRCNPARFEHGKRQFFRFDFRVDPSISENELARELAAKFREAVCRRTSARFGTAGLGLSGGLDSRAILSAIEDRDRLVVFSLFDEENAEFETARSIARACGVSLKPIRRDPEHYGEWAELGVRISGAGGCIRSNHYLGVRRQLCDLGIKNLLTGCYCDYVFKGLALNTRESTVVRTQQLDRFALEYYLPCYWPATRLKAEVENRLRALYPKLNGDVQDQDWLEVEQRRTFPLAYEGDSAMRLIPQRVIPWYLPIADNGLLDIYLRTPSRWKLNTSIFRKMLTHLCSRQVLEIPDNNTGSRVTAGMLTRAYHRYRTALQNRVEKRLKARIAERGSWPNWEFYVHHSAAVARTWGCSRETSRGVLAEVLGEDPFARTITSFRGREVELFSRIWTIDLWLGQRCSAN